MPFELFSQRRAKRAGRYPPKPTKAPLSQRLRTALIITIVKCIGRYDDSINYVYPPYRGNNLWAYISETLLKKSDEYYDFQHKLNANAFERLWAFFHNSSDDGLVDALDLSVFTIDVAVDDLQQQTDRYELAQAGVTLSSKAALAELDELLRTNGTIYRIAQNHVVVSTEDFTHEEAILPALQALAEPGFENALREFHEALADRRNGRYADALTKANHAFESTVKIIASRMKWPFNETDTANKLTSVLLKNGLFPPMRESALTGLRLMLESDVPSLRNKTPSAGHGAGTKSSNLPEPVATYALVAAAANVRLLVELYHIKMGR